MSGKLHDTDKSIIILHGDKDNLTSIQKKKLYLGEPVYTKDEKVLSITDNTFNGNVIPVVSQSRITLIDDDYALSLEEHTILADGSSNTIDIELPEAPHIGKTYKIKAIDITNEVKVVPNGSDKIDGEDDYVFTQENESVTFVSDGIEWRLFDLGKEQINPTITLTGDVTGSGTTTITTTIANNAVTNVKLADMPGHTVKLNAGGSSADPQDFALGSHDVLGRNGGNIISLNAGNNTVLRRGTGNTLAFGAVDISTSQVTGTLPISRGGTNRTSLDANKVMVGNGTTAVLTPSNLHWDNANNRLGIGQSAADTSLVVVTPSNTDSIQIRRNSNTANDRAVLGFRISTGNGSLNWAEIAGVRTNNPVSGDTDLAFITRGNDTNAERVRITSLGNIGVGKIPVDYAVDIDRVSRFGIRLVQTGTYDWLTENTARGIVIAPTIGYSVPSNTTYHGIDINMAGLTNVTTPRGIFVSHNTGNGIRVESTVSFGVGAIHTQNAGFAGHGIYALASGTSGTAGYFVVSGASTQAIFAGGNVFVNSDSQLQFRSASVYVNSPAVNTLALYTNNAERMRLDATGNIGIGITAPTARLHISKSGISANEAVVRAFCGTVDADNTGVAIEGLASLNNLGITGEGTVAGVVGGALGDGGTGHAYGVVGYAQNGFRNWAGYFGDGNVSVVNNLIIGGNENSLPTRQLTFTDTGLGFERITTNTLGIYTNNTERVRIDNNGNVGVNISAGGTVKFRVNPNVAWGIYVGAGATTSAITGIVNSTTADALRVQQNSNTGHFIRFQGSVSSNSDWRITTYGAGGTDETISAGPDYNAWSHEGMVKVNINGNVRWMPYYNQL